MTSPQACIPTDKTRYSSKLFVSLEVLSYRQTAESKGLRRSPDGIDYQERQKIKKKNRLAITKNVLKNITEEEPLTVSDLNFDTAFKVAWTRFRNQERSRIRQQRQRRTHSRIQS